MAPAEAADQPELGGPGRRPDDTQPVQGPAPPQRPPAPPQPSNQRPEVANEDRLQAVAPSLRPTAQYHDIYGTLTNPLLIASPIL